MGVLFGILLFFLSLFICVAAIVRVLQHKTVKKMLWVALIMFLGSVIIILISSGMDSSSLILLLGLFLVLVSVLVLLASLIQKLRKKSYLVLFRIGLGVLGSGVLLVIIESSYGNVSSALLLSAVALMPVILISFGLLIVRLLLRKPVGLIKIVMPLSLVACIGLIWISSAMLNCKRNQLTELGDIHEVENLQTELDFEVIDGDAPLEVEEYSIIDGYNDKNIHIYDSDHLDLLFDENFFVTAADCKKRVEENSKIPDKFKAYFYDFIDRINKKYSDADLTILYHNLDTLSVTELNDFDYLMKSMNSNSLGVYRLDENAIYIPKGTEYKEGEFGFQVLIHEFCHAVRCSWQNGSNRQSASFKVASEDDLLQECMNTVFSCNLLNYEERDLAYQTASNYLKVMLECMDNYSLSDYINHGSTYFLSKLDETSGYTNYSTVIWKLISLQRNDYYEDNIKISEEKYNPIYDFLAELYFDKYLTEDMTEGERQEIANELTNKVFYDTSDDYPANRERIYEYLDIYIQSENMK